MIPLEFPNYIPTRCNSTLDQDHLKTVCQGLASIRRLADIQNTHLGQLNVQLEGNVSLPELVPDKRFGVRPLLYDSDLTDMLVELEVDNEDAYREVLRLAPLEGRKKPRLAYSRNFFSSLEDMSRYWDDSKDNYYEIETNDIDEESTSPKSGGKIGQENQRLSDQKVEEPARLSQSTNRLDKPLRPHNTSGTPTTVQPIEMPTRSKMKQVYKGNRLGNGEQMSPGTRVAAIRNLIKMAVHKFNCRDYDVSPRERFRIRNINLPAVTYNFCVARLPADTKLLRARMVEGPLMAAYCRNDVRFKSREGLLGPTSDFMGEKFDFFREIGGMLMLAKQRKRQGQILSQEPREDQWWAIKNRWGGGETKWGQLSSEVFEEDDPSWSPEERRLQQEKRVKEDEERRSQEAVAAADFKHLMPDDLISGPLTPSSERPKKKKKSGDDSGPKDRAEYKDGRRLMYVPPLRRKWYQEWLKIRPNGPCWDEKMICRAIGKPRDGEGTSAGWDEVYMISAVNHHACILKMSVHNDYLEWLETGDGGKAKVADAPEQCSEPRQSHVLYVSRSPWYDLFEIEERRELLIGLWRILSWMNRDEVPKQDVEKMDECKRQQREQAKPAESVDVEMGDRSVAPVATMT